MTVVYTEDREKIVRWKYYTVYQNGISTYSETTPSSDVCTTSLRVFNEPMSRVRPAVLALSPTDRAAQSTTISRYRLWENKFLTTVYSPSLGSSLETGTFSGPCLQLGTQPSYTASIGWEMKIREKLEQQVVNLGETLFEYRQTADLFYSAATRVAKLWRDFRRLKRLKFSKLGTKDVAAAEVLSVFGINPLLGTVYDSAQVLMNRLEEPVYTRVRARVSETARYKSVYSTGNVIGAWKKSQRAVFYAELAVEKRRIQIGSPLEIAWELIPFSFLVDWFIPVGDWLGCLDALKGVKQCPGSVTTTLLYAGKDYRAEPYYGKPATLLRAGSLSYRGNARKAYTTVPIPVPRIWKPSASWRKVLTAVSLLRLLHRD